MPFEVVPRPHVGDDMIVPSRPPWWSKKRWIAVALLWLLVWYPLSIGPYIYVKERGWLSGYGYTFGHFWDPVPYLLGCSSKTPFKAEEAPLLWHCWSDYAQIWREAAIRHREADQPDKAE